MSTHASCHPRDLTSKFLTHTHLALGDLVTLRLQPGHHLALCVAKVDSVELRASSQKKDKPSRGGERTQTDTNQTRLSSWRTGRAWISPWWPVCAHCAWKRRRKTGLASSPIEGKGPCWRHPSPEAHSRASFFIWMWKGTVVFPTPIAPCLCFFSCLIYSLEIISV
jgi:hypothetical protein